MDPLIALIINIVFLVIVGAMGLLLALCIYIYVRYGRTQSITISSSLMVIAIFLIAVTTAYTTLQAIISLYA